MKIFDAKISELKKHPLNIKIYGDKCDDQLIVSVAKVGILTPILITKSNQVISGHRRVEAAKANNLKVIPARHFKSDDDLSIEEALILANEQRVRTTEQKAREYSHLRSRCRRIHRSPTRAGVRSRDDFFPRPLAEETPP